MGRKEFIKKIIQGLILPTISVALAGKTIDNDQEGIEQDCIVSLRELHEKGCRWNPGSFECINWRDKGSNQMRWKFGEYVDLLQIPENAFYRPDDTK